ncbi:MAG: UDP-3-O-(3-hydroxymyristoyl)glucosamine N-acyltransferase [Acidobacteriota bacterium]
MKLVELAAHLGCLLEGDGEIEITRINSLEGAGPGDLTFLANSKYTGLVGRCQASAIIASPTLADAPCAILRTDNPYLAFARAARVLHPEPRRVPGIHALAVVSTEAHLGDEVSVGPFAVIEAGARVGARSIIHAHAVIGAGATLGPDCVVHTRVSIRERVVVGARCVFQDGAVVGSDGFGFAVRDDGTHERIPQVATVVIEDDVEIGANSTIDRPAVGETRVRSGTKLDNLVHLAHGVVVGRNSMLAAQVGIAGSTILGDDVMLGGQVGVTGHVTVGDRVKASAKTGVTGNVPPDTFITGYPHMENLEWRKAFAIVRRLPELRRQLKDLEGRLARLEKA